MAAKLRTIRIAIFNLLREIPITSNISFLTNSPLTYEYHYNPNFQLREG